MVSSASSWLHVASANAAVTAGGGLNFRIYGLAMSSAPPPCDSACNQELAVPLLAAAALSLLDTDAEPPPRVVRECACDIEEVPTEQRPEWWIGLAQPGVLLHV